MGAGLLGLSSALSLAEEGHTVTVHEQHQPGAGASSKAAGLVSTMTWNDHDFRLIQETRGKIGEIISMAMIEGDPAARHLWKPYDSITIAHGDGLQVLDEVQAISERNTEETERLSWQAAAKEFPGIRFEPGDEVLIAQEDGAVEAGDLVSVLEGRCRAEEVHFETGRVTDLHTLDGKVVVAGGAWTHGLLAAHGAELPMAAFRTQLASIAHPGSLELPMVHDTRHGFYLRPESDGSLLAGDGTILKPHDPDHYDEAADPSFRESIAERMLQRVAGAETAHIRNAWAGLCVATPDRHPLCGPVPGLDDVFVLTGDNGFGLMRCLALGDRLADAVRTKVDAVLDPGRFVDVGEWEMKEGFGW